jgi:hypothetical protein
MQHLNTDLIDLFVALNEAGAKYLIVGGYAFAIHGRVRATNDIDIYVGTDPHNAAAVWRALEAFGAPLDDLTIDDLRTPDTYFLMGRPPNQIDVLTSIDGVNFDHAWSNRFPSAYGGVDVQYIGRAELVANKKACGRPHDLADLAYLLEHEPQQA